MYRKLLLIIFIIFIFFTESCVVKTANIDTAELSLLQSDESNLKFTYEQMLEDYDLLWLMLNENVPFAITAANNKGKSTKNIQNDYRDMIHKDLSAQEFVDIIVKCINEFESLAHLKVVAEEPRNKYMQTLKSSPEIINVLKNPKSELLYNTLDLSMQYIYSNISQDTADIDNFECIDESIKAYISKNDNTAYIRFNDFSLQSEKTSRFITFYKKIKDYDNLIIDVRNNPGGSTFVWKNCIVSLLALEDIQYDVYAMFNMGQNSSLYYTTYNPELLKSIITEKDWIYNTQYFKDTCRKNKALENVIVKSKATIKKSSMSINYEGKIWVLTDGNTYSAADSFTYFCKRTNFATTVGNRTKGNGVSPIENLICFYALPNSGIIIRYFPFMGFNIDGSSNTESGDIPDIYTNEDALEFCLKEINKMKAE